MGKAFIFCKRVLPLLLVTAVPVVTACAETTLAQGPALAQEQPGANFDQWLDGLRQEALTRGISSATLDRAFRNVAPIDRVLELDRRQPEFSQSFWSYLDRAISDARVDKGKALLVQHAALLGRIEARFGVQPRFLVAFWGLETNFGEHLGGFPVIGALATLAHDPRRSDFFRAELLAALSILEAGDIDPQTMMGSWAGAMGQPQFMPTTFVRYATDGDGDGHRDIWTSLPDVFASASNFLKNLGWDGQQTWGREVVLPAGFDIELADLKIRKPVSAWQDLGVRRPGGGPLPSADFEASIVLPAGASGPAFLVYGNFRAILGWNRSILYAVAVGHLADRFVGGEPIQAKRPAGDERLSRDEILAMQEALGRLGFEAGTPDGIVGAQTREALKGFQRSRNLPPDGYPTPALVRQLRAAAGI